MADHNHNDRLRWKGGEIDLARLEMEEKGRVEEKDVYYPPN